MTRTQNSYSASRNVDRSGNPSMAERNRWRGWVQFNGTGTLTFTPDTYATKREALAAIKAQQS
jgi:hypothetical protein